MDMPTLRWSSAGHSAVQYTSSTLVLNRVLRAALFPFAALAFTACGTTTSPTSTPPAASGPASIQGGTPLFGLTSLDFGATPVSPGTSAEMNGLTLTLKSSQVTAGAGLITFWNTYVVRNSGKTAVQNLTLLAVHRAAGLAGTAITAMSTVDGEGLTDPTAARGLLPDFQTSASTGQVDAEAYAPDESLALTAAAQMAGLLDSGDEALGYGFSVQREDGSRILAPGEQGKVTVSYVLPGESASVLPTRFTASFLLVQDEVTRVTQLDGEALNETLNRAGQPVNARQIMTLGLPSTQAVQNIKVVPVSPLRTFAVPRGPLYGVIQSQSRRLTSDYQAGLRVRSLELAWDRVEPAFGSWNTAYLASKRAEYLADVRAGFEVVLDLGVQYPPAWLTQLPDSHFVDQHGTVYTSTDPGANPVNAVFNSAVRSLQARYVRQVFQTLGSTFYGVRLGFGRYGELGFPLVDAKANSYWAFDAMAQGQRPGLPAGVQVNPVPGWSPASATQPVMESDRLKAQRFLDWYLNSLKNYHDWQIQLVRGLFPGRLFMLYPSFGLRPGQLDLALAGGLTGRTSPEINTELQRGFDFARFISGVNDPLVSPYTTWLDVDGFFVNDAGTDPAGWSPAHYFSVLAAANPVPLQVWGENTGRNSRADLSLCIQRVKAYRLGGMFWAFNSDLYDSVHASIADYRSMIATW